MIICLVGLKIQSNYYDKSLSKEVELHFSKKAFKAGSRSMDLVSSRASAMISLTPGKGI